MTDKQMKMVTDIIVEEDIIDEEDGVIMVKEVEQQTSMAIQRETLGFEKLMEMANVLSKSTIVPVQYQNRPENIFISLDLASRMGISVMMVMQNLYIINGKPSWSGQFIASLIRSNPQFRDVELNYVGEEGKETWGAYVSATNVRTGKILKGATVTIKMARMEGWMSKTGSKWLTLPELMLAYRSFAYFGRIYCPELLAGLQSSDELEDILPSSKSEVINPYANK